MASLNHHKERATTGRQRRHAIRSRPLPVRRKPRPQNDLQEECEALRASLLEVELSRDQYVDMLDLAPIGFAILDHIGSIVSINTTGARLLGLRRNLLKNKQLASLLSRPNRLKFLRHLNQ